MKKLAFTLALTLIVSVFAFTLSSCDQAKDFVDNVTENYQKLYTYDYAIIAMPDGTTLKIELAGYCMGNKTVGNNIDYTNDSFSYDAGATAYYDTYYLYGKDGTGYVVSQRNCVLIQDPSVNIDAKMVSYAKTHKYNEATVKNLDGTFSVYKNPKFTDGTPTYSTVTIETEDGIRYSIHADNVWITFTYES